MTKIETFVYEYEHCIECGHCNSDHWNFKIQEDDWGCSLTGKILSQVDIMRGKIPKWCTLTTKGETQ